MKFRVLSPAFEDISQAAAWFDAQRPGLGIAFWRSVDDVLERIRQDPQQFGRSEFAEEELDFRFALVRQFNYVVHYLLEQDEVQIVCVAHGARKPGHWLGRTKAE